MPRPKTTFVAVIALTLLAANSGCPPQTCAFDADMNGEFSIIEGLNAADQITTDLGIEFEGNLEDLETIDDQIIAALTANPFILLQYAPCLEILENQFNVPTTPETQP
jgi:hypothetical protein